jgi:hypothetical protein
MTLTDYINKIKKLVKDDANYLSNDDIAISLDNALLKLSKDYPLIIDQNYNGNDGYEYDLPGNWVDGFSYIQAIEYPYGNQIPEYLEETEFTIYQNNNARKIRFLNKSVGNTECFAVIFAIPYMISSGNNNVPDSLCTAVCNLAAYYACLILTGKFSQTQNIDIKADLVNYNEQTEKFRKLAIDYYNVYENLLFNKSITVSGDYSIKASLVTRHCKLKSGQRIFHD